MFKYFNGGRGRTQSVKWSVFCQSWTIDSCLLCFVIEVNKSDGAVIGKKKKKTSQRCRAFIILRWEQLYNNAPVLMNMTMSVQQSTANLLLKIGDTEAGKWKIERTKWLLQGFSFAAFMLLTLKYKIFSCPELLVVYIPPLKCPEGAKHRSKGKMESDLAPSVMHA